ncbi:ROK family protein [bacterium]|nr:ROK family protein [bacterium]
MAPIYLDDKISKNDLPRRYAIGLDLGGTHLKYGIISDRGEIVYKNFTPGRTSDGGKKVLNVMAEAAHECMMFAKKENITISAAGAGCPGTIDSEQGISLGPTIHITAWEGAEIAEAINKKIHLPVFADNDANFMAFGEYIAGAGRQKQFVVGITLGTGVGGGIVIDGNIHRGAVFNAAELGHVVVEAEGRVCSCGNRGCIERYVGAKYIVQDVVDALSKGEESIITQGLKSTGDITPILIFAAAKHGDELCGRIVDQMVKYLGAGLTSIVNVINPDVIVIGGGMSDAGPVFIKRIGDEVLSRVMKPVRKQLQVVQAQLGNDAGIMGSAMYAMKQLTLDNAQ